MQNHETLDIDGVAALLHAERETVMQFARRGELAGTRIGKSWVFLREDVIAFLRQHIAADTQARQRSICEPIAMAVSTPAKSRRRKPPALPQLHVVSGQESKC
jgi:excisionase family DNA binding protein